MRYVDPTGKTIKKKEKGSMKKTIVKLNMCFCGCAYIYVYAYMYFSDRLRYVEDGYRHLLFRLIVSC